ncbi:ATP-binding protein [Plantibacter sp. LMC-P-059a]|jgi:signal transduction histidine kinase|uniref:sensor histidine kinase n=1 Tax=Plantibacter sp. LMC-P-059a TaxID=3040297 RepID=UPI0025517AC0|nr:ATP-binding protein [Plantibacter sp. LMC-P-059a]
MSPSFRAPTRHPAIPADTKDAQAQRRMLNTANFERLLGRSVAIIGLVFGLQTAFTTLGQGVQIDGWIGVLYVVAVFGSMGVAIGCCFFLWHHRLASGVFAAVFFVALLIWPAVNAPAPADINQEPWIWYLCTIAVAFACVPLKLRGAIVYLVVTSLMYGVNRIIDADFAPASWEIGTLDASYATIIGGLIVVLVGLFRVLAGRVDVARAAALSTYDAAVKQHATEVERVEVDSIVHDSVLASLLAADRAMTPKSEALAVMMARVAIEQLEGVGAPMTNEDEVTGLAELVERLRGAASMLGEPFAVTTEGASGRVLPVTVANAVYWATVQAMVNSVEHAGQGVARSLSIEGTVSGGVCVIVSDDGVGFCPDAVAEERLGLKVSIVERMAGVGGRSTVLSRPGEGAVIRIEWSPEDAS